MASEKNFAYIAALASKLAFIIDVRRQNMIEHLMYKVLFEISPDRGEFVSHPFSRRITTVLGTASTAEDPFGNQWYPSTPINRENQ